MVVVSETLKGLFVLKHDEAYECFSFLNHLRDLERLSGDLFKRIVDKIGTTDNGSTVYVKMLLDEYLRLIHTHTEECFKFRNWWVSEREAEKKREEKLQKEAEKEAKEWERRDEINKTSMMARRNRLARERRQKIRKRRGKKPGGFLR